jgi:NAD(P)-dependent dehydrogenase (short-subunit alcohol dehydrogenase family)
MNKVALVTGASRGLGASLAREMTRDGWTLIIDGRSESDLTRTALGLTGEVVQVPGDITDPDHRRELGEVAVSLGGLDLLVLNAGTLGPTPLPRLETLDLGALADTFEVNAVSQLAVIQAVLPALTRRSGAVVAVSSDAAVEPYEGWGAYAASKAALDQLTRVLAVERPDLAVWAIDPGDMRTDMAQAAFPGEDISDRASPDVAAAAIVTAVAARPPSGRIRVSDLTAALS